MKLKSLLILTLLALGLSAQAQLTTGDIAFTAFNTDGDDDIAFVTFEDIAPNTTIYFADSELTDGAFGDDEGDVIWVSGANPIPAGTVITISSISDAGVASIGTVTGDTGLSSSGEAVFAYLGTDVRVVTTFLAAISNLDSGFGDLSGSGLYKGSTAIVLTETADIAEYVGPKTGIDKNGYLSYLNDMSNWVIQDTEDDDQNDTVSPDLPFNTTTFGISATDVTPPNVAGIEVVSQNTIHVVFTENVDEVSATTTSNYVFSPSSTISDITYDEPTQTATLSHSGLTPGASTTLAISNIEDLASNSMASTYTSEAFYFNPTTPELIITEIMYNAPSDASNDLEFIEIYNAGEATAALGGIQVVDEGNFAFSFPQMDLAAGETVLLATNPTAAGTFYSKTFLALAASSGNLLGNGGELLQIKNTDGTTLFEVEYDDASPWATDADGNGPSLELIALNKDTDDGASWVASSTLVAQSEGLDVFASPGIFTEVTTPALSFDEEYVTVSTEDATVTITVTLSDPSTSEITVDADLVDGFGSSSIIMDTKTLTFPANSTASQTFTVDLTASANNNDYFFVLQLGNAAHADLGSLTETVVYVLNEDIAAPTASSELIIAHATSYLVDEDGSAEIVAFDKDTERLFVLNSTATKVEILDFSNPRAITSIKSIDMTSYGNGATSIAVKDGLIAATVVGENFADGGKVIFMDTDGVIHSSVTVGNLPDMVTFSPDGKYVLTANEGQPNDDYSVDPEGSISMIDISGDITELTQSDVTTLTFNAFDTQIDDLRTAGVRVFGLNASVSEDMEPEYITISSDSKTAWVSLQENNALATINLETKTITEINALGVKDHSLAKNSLDASDKTEDVIMANWPVKGMYMPDAIASYTVNNVTYVVTANEGDQREYDGIDEDVTISDAEYVLDPTTFPQADLMKKEFTIGRLAVSPYSGDTDNDGDFDEIHAFGARSFSIWNTSTNEIVYDSGNDFELITALDPTYGELFNASNSNNNFKNRSDNKGPEPEGITVAEIDGKQYAFITLERTGGLMTYNITDPLAPVFVDYSNNRDLGEDEGGDLGPEGIIYIDPVSSPADTALIVMANEVSATVSVYYIKNVIVSAEEEEEETSEVTAVSPENSNALKVYPTPASDKVYFSQPTSYTLHDMNGAQLKQGTHAVSLHTSDLTNGIYILKNAQGQSTKIVITH
ncbi:choice-of-anchor I family protein [Reichenbachiella carrageenanivorans]|uniref:Choice-of-anchor I family protein n=1 Tax=Reichenbachiella carrageenanivorans TaxID=2979869 RepID=A0ABY6CYN5_9BACT|nr:choice-of-anchor I family protein [Reichenbachiella carrageenanivorans]UXX79031.1 choice-of-anchor I family protein [Reichenbachiella carrageenanivorans]